jgi:hypothetical protein
MVSGDKKKLALVIVLFLAAGAIWFFRSRSSSPLSGSISFVDVSTGERIALDRDDVPSVMPAVNPKTGQRLLLPVEERDGKVFVRGHYKSYLDELSKDNNYVDPKTLEVRRR